MTQVGTTLVGIHEAKTHFSELIRRVAAGEEIVISRGGKPVARLSPVTRRVPILGVDEGVFTVPDDFNEMTEEELALFEGDDLEL